LKKIRSIAFLNEKFNKTSHSFAHLWTMYNTDPPNPPYNFLFETQKEAESFAKRAEEKYDVHCEIDPIDVKKWLLKSISKVTKLKEKNNA
jgi:hypothetical protein